MKIRYIIITVIFGIIFMPNIKAASSYSVEMVSGSSSNRIIGHYNTYSEALNVMNSQNSSESSVATIYRDGTPIDSKYGIFKFKPNILCKFYKNSNSTNSYTTINSSYGSDAAILGYSENGRIKIMISGFIGYTDINNGVVTPISLLSGNMINVNGSGVRLRTSPSLSAQTYTNISGNNNFNYTETKDADGYTWYKISYNGKELWIAGGSWVTKYNSTLNTYYLNYSPTGNLIHHFEIYSGVNYTDNFTNLGTSPSYLNQDVRYYSYDGNYFYSNITSMLNDYREGNYNNSINKNNPYYSYYMYLPAHSKTGYSASDLNNIISSKGYNASNSKMYGTGEYFKEAEEIYGTNALLAFSTALNESNWGTSAIAMNKNNLFGYGAYDTCPYDCAYSYSSPKESIMSYASSAASSYESVNGKYYYGSHYGNKASGKNIMYATDPYWGEKMAMNAFIKDKNYGGKDFNSNTIGVERKQTTAAWVFDEPIQTESHLLYKLKNKNTSDGVQDISVNIIDKIESNGITFYKIYTDLPDRNPKYGYVWADEWNLSNNQPTINANNKEIKVGENFDYRNEVTASDIENGDLTNRITYEGNVDTSKEGTYKVKYEVTDNSNFHASKEVEIKVVNDNQIIIEAENREITQFDDFDYLENVKAYDKTNDYTNLITYEGKVDTSKEGTYEITYKVKVDNRETNKKVIIKVNKNEKPIIEAQNKEVIEGDEYNPLEGVTAQDKEDGDLTDKITYTGNFDTNKPGSYEITYKVQDKNKQETEKIITLTVLKDESPIINAKDREIILNKEFNPLEGITAQDKEDGDITDKITYTGNVDSSKEGSYNITYQVSDSKKQKTTKTINVKVVKKELKEVEGEFYLNNLIYKDNEFEVSGYLIQKNVSNSIDDNIKFYILFKDKNTENEYKIPIERWIKDVPYDLSDQIDYSGAWFKGKIELSNIPKGDYDIQMYSESDEYYTKQLFNNIMNNELKHRAAKNNKSYTFKVLQKLKSKAVILSVRDSIITESESPTFRNMINDYDNIDFDGSIMEISGTSYNYGGNYSNKNNITRELIFENIKTFEQFKFDVGATNTGSYKVTSLDNLSKEYAWFNKKIDISNLPKGTYSLIVHTKSENVDDYGELTDMFASARIDNDNYSISVNKDREKRIELIIK